jgi:hypothetical protein
LYPSSIRVHGYLGPVLRRSHFSRIFGPNRIPPPAASAPPTYAPTSCSHIRGRDDTVLPHTLLIHGLHCQPISPLNSGVAAVALNPGLPAAAGWPAAWLPGCCTAIHQAGCDEEFEVRCRSARTKGPQRMCTAERLAGGLGRGLLAPVPPHRKGGRAGCVDSGHKLLAVCMGLITRV